MLSCLTIDNIALISHGEINFSDGFVVLTGETGAGKSIIIDSISLILGMRADRELIRSGENSAQVSALFDKLNPIENKRLADIGVSLDEGQLLLYRQIFADGRSVAKVNGKTVTATVLREIAGKLVNIHGQHEYQILTDPARHLEILDLYANDKDAVSEYAEAYKNAKQIQKRILDLSQNEKEKRQRAEYLHYIISEIDKVDPKPDEDELLSEKKKNFEMSSKINSAIGEILSSLFGKEDTPGACAQIKKSLIAVEDISNVIPGGDIIKNRLKELSVEADDIASELAKIKIADDIGESDIDRIEERLFSIEKLCRKYGGSVKAVIEQKNSAQSELFELEHIDDELKRLADEYTSAKTVLADKAEKLSKIRKNAADILCREVCKVLEFLDMPGVTFCAKQEKFLNAKGNVFYSAYGVDKVEFLISANAGEEPKPLSKIASGGELSRIILAIKSALSEKEGTGTLIFDEIDTGISGKTSYKVGLKLLEASRTAQVFCVTHSAQIASLADMHIKVKKSAENGRSYSSADVLTEEERIKEVARIIGGDVITTTIISSANELITHGKELKAKLPIKV